MHEAIVMHLQGMIGTERQFLRLLAKLNTWMLLHQYLRHRDDTNSFLYHLLFIIATYYLQTKRRAFPSLPFASTEAHENKCPLWY